MKGRTHKAAGLALSLDHVYLDLFLRGYTVDHRDPPHIVPISEVEPEAMERLVATMERIRARIEAVA